MSLRASHGDTSGAANAGGMVVPACGRLTTSGASPRATASHDRSVIAAPSAAVPSTAGIRSSPAAAASRPERTSPVATPMSSAR